jgi:hypothetical protein
MNIHLPEYRKKNIILAETLKNTSLFVFFVTLLFLIVTPSVTSIPMMSFDKNYYVTNDVVSILTKDPSPLTISGSLTLEVSIKEDTNYYFKYLGSVNEIISFIPTQSGEYIFRLYNENGNLIDEKSFLVYDKSVDSCATHKLGSQILIDLEEYAFDLGSKLPSEIELIYSNALSTNKIVYNGGITPQIYYTPSIIGKYSLYADGIYLACYDIIDDFAIENSKIIHSTNENLNNITYLNNQISNQTSNSMNKTTFINGLNISLISNQYDSKNTSSIVIDLNNSLIQSETGRLKKKIILFKIKNSLNESLNADTFVYEKEKIVGTIQNTNSNNKDYASNVKDNILENNLLLNTRISVIDYTANTSISNNAYTPDFLVINDTSASLQNASLDADIEFVSGSVKKINFKNLEYKENMEVGVDEVTEKLSSNKLLEKSEKKELKAYAVNLYDLNFTAASFTSIAVGTELWKCKDWNFTTQSCFGTWSKLMDIIPGQEYNVSLFPGDPGFIETFDVNVAIDIDILALDNNTVVLAWIKNGTTVTGNFEIWNTNGSIIVNDTTFDAGMDTQSRVSLDLINTNDFIIASIDGSTNISNFYFYNRTGSMIQSATTISANVGDFNDLSVCQLGDRFIYSYIDANPAQFDGSFQIVNNSGNFIGTITDVDTTVTTTTALQNFVSCAAINITNWVYLYYDVTSSDVTLNARTNTGTNVVLTDLNANVGTTSQVAVATSRNEYIANLYYNSVAATQDVILNIRQLNGAVLTNIATVTPDATAGANIRLDIAEIDALGTSYFVPTWYDAGDTTIKAAVYNETGGQITAPFIVTTTPNTGYRIVAVAGYNSNAELGLCNGTFVIAYTNSSGNAIFNKYLINGSQWNGICPDVTPPTVNLTYPSNDSIVENNNISFNFTVIDDRDVVLPNCSLYTNFTGNFIINKTIYNVTSGIETSINVTNIDDGKYIWNIRCYDNSSNNAFAINAPNNFTLYINKNIPSITNPLINRTVLNQSNYVQLNVTISDSFGISNALLTMLYPNGTKINYTLSNSGNNYYYNFNNTVQLGIYNITLVWANDTLGQSNQNNTLILSFNVTASPPSDFNLLAPTNATVSTNLIPNMNWQQTTDETFANYTLILDKDSTFATPDYTYAISPITNTSYILGFALDVNSVYYWRVIAYDIFGNSKNSTNDFIYITDNSGPLITLNIPETNSFVLMSNVLFNYTPIDANTISNCTLYTNATGTFSPNQTNFTIANTLPNYLSMNLNDGYYLWNILCFDQVGNYKFSNNNFTLKIDTTPPNVTILNPQNNTYENNTNNVLFYGNATDVMTGVDNCSLIINNTVRQTKSVTEGIVFNFTEFVSNGNYVWNINCTDSNGFIGSSVNYFINVSVVDTNPPLIQLNTPTNNEYINTSTIIFNYTVDDASGIENCSIFIGGILNSTNYTVSNHQDNLFTISEFTFGTKNWRIACYDNTTERNYRLSSTRNFIVDLTNPVVTLNIPGNSTTPLYLNYSTIEFNYTPSDANLYSCALYANFTGSFIEEQINLTPTNSQNNYFTQTINDGNYAWNILCTDLSSRSSFALQNYLILVDTHAPDYSNINVSPYSNSPYNSSKKYFFNITWTDNFEISQVIFESDIDSYALYGISGNLTNYTINSSDLGSSKNYSINFTNIAAGNYVYTWYAIDAAGNLNKTELLTYNVSQENSSVNLLINGSDANFSINEGNYVNLTGTLLVPLIGVIDLYVGESLINSGIAPIYNITLFENPGIYNVTAFYNYSQNYSSSSDTHFVIVSDISSPLITLNVPITNSPIASGEITLQYIVNDKSDIANCSLYINGTLNQTDNSITRNVTQFFVVSLPQGNYTWTVDCYDNSSNHNYNISTTWIFRALDASVINLVVSPLESQYEIVENAIIEINTTGQFNDTLNTNFTADIIYGNTSLPWWNTSFKYRKNLLFTENYNNSRDVTMDVNITGLSALINNCTTQTRIVEIVIYNGTINQSIIPFEILSGDDSNNCFVRFNVNISALQNNQTRYLIYYDNTSTTSATQTVPLKGINIQRDTVSATGATLTVGITSANRSKSFILFTSRVGSTGPNQHEITSDMLIDTQIRFERYLGTTAANIYWQLIEGSDINVQRGLTSFIATDANINVTVNSVNLSNSFLIINGRVNSGTAGQAPRGIFEGRFINSTTISLSRGITGTAAIAGWQVVEWSKTNVQSNNLTLTANPVIVNINPVVVNRSFLIISRTTTGDTGADTNYVLGYIINSTAINISRVGTTGSTVVTWFVVELPNEYYIQSGQVSTTNSVNQAITSVDMSQTFNSESWSSTQTGTTYTNAMMTSFLTNSTNMNYTKQTAVNTNVIGWFAIQSRDPQYSIDDTHKFITRESNVTGALGTYNLVWNTANQSFGNYSVVVTATKANYTTAYDYGTFELIPDQTPPNVTLLTPLNATVSGSGYFNFTYVPFDLTLASCTLYMDINGIFGPQATNLSPINNASNTFSSIYVGAGFFNWNINCTDLYNNSGFSPYNYTLNITGPDLVITRDDIWFSNDSRLEFGNITLFANITNQGLSPANRSFIVQFFRGDPDTTGIQIGSNITIINMTVGEVITINTTYLLTSGLNNIFVKLDSNNLLNESEESNNKANNSLNIGLYQYYFGNVSRNFVFGSPSGNLTVFYSEVNSTPNGYLFIADADSVFSFANLQALSRNINNNSVNNDFSDLDISLNSTGSSGSINEVWTNNTDSPLHVDIINLTSKIINDVPFINSTTNSSFETGILWDTSDDLSLNLQYDPTDKEDVVFVTKISTPMIGSYGTYNYELKIPSNLRSYSGSVNMVTFYYELK